MEELDIVAFCAEPVAYRLLAHWAALNRHRLLLVVAEPAADAARRDPGSAGLAALLPPEQDVLATRRLRTTAAPVIAALQPDLIVSAAFPRPIPAEVTVIPRFGAIDVRPGRRPPRGPHSGRDDHEGEACAAVTVRRVLATGAGSVLATRERRLPEAAPPEQIRAAWGQAVTAALDEATARAAAGDPGEAADEAWAAVAPVAADGWPSWDALPGPIQRRSAVLGGAAHPAGGHAGGDAVLRVVTLPGPAVEQGRNAVAVRHAERAAEAAIGG